MNALHFLGHWTGISDEGGAGYALWSGIGSGSPLLAGIALAYRHHNCHRRWCLRLGHSVTAKDGTTYLTCHRHHPTRARKRRAVSALPTPRPQRV